MKTVFLLGSAPSLNLISEYVKKERDIYVGCNEVITGRFPLDWYVTIEADCYKTPWYRREVPKLNCPVVCQMPIKRKTEKLNPRVEVNGVHVEQYVPGKFPVDREYRPDHALYTGRTVLMPMLHYALILGATRVILCGFDLCFLPTGYYFNCDLKAILPGWGTSVSKVKNRNGDLRFASDSFIMEAEYVKYFMKESAHTGVVYEILDGDGGMLDGKRVTVSELEAR